MSSIVIPAARTGSESSSRTAVMRTDHTKRGGVDIVRGLEVLC